MPAKLANTVAAAPTHSSKKHPALKQQHGEQQRPTSAALTAKNLLGASQSAPNAAKKHDDHDAGQLFVDKRLFAARATHKLDLSSSAHIPFPITYQCFPRQVLLHAQMGHQLRELWLTNHHIGVLPPEIGHCGASLRVLGLSSNALSSLPDELGSLTNLEALYLEKNRIATISASFRFPPKLRDLRLDGNLLTAFPLSITRLWLLNHLGLSHNQIAEVPHEIRRLLNLVELDLDYNCIRSEGLPQEEMETLKNLERLGLERNHLDVSALDRLKQLPALVVLRLNGNRSIIPKDIGESSESQSVPIRHGGYFQTTQGSQVPSDPAVDSELSTPSEDDVQTSSSHNGSGHRSRLLEGVVPCREQNMMNAEFYRSGLASGVLREGGSV
ncbi:Lysosomal pro-x carboxypeptidase, partial [Globisporangium splendens]